MSGESASQAKASAGSHRAGTLLLPELTPRSAGLGKWDVGVFHPRIEQWQAPTTGKDGVVFRCILVSLQNPAAYLPGEIGMRNQEMRPLERAQSKFKENFLS